MNSTSRVVRKRLDDDCLMDGGLHPSIAERLERVRELPIRQVANLGGVEVDPDGVWLVWQYVEGIPLEQFLQKSPPQSRLDEIARDLRRAVQAMHVQGVVHGALHARNIIIDPRGQVILTHVSPLLFSDEESDQRALRSLMGALGQPGATRFEPADRDAMDDRATRVKAYSYAGAAVLGGVVMFLLILWYIRG